MSTIKDAVILTFVMGAVIFFCRLLPFIFFKNSGKEKESKLQKAFLSFVERTAPPVTMAALLFNALLSKIKSDTALTLPALTAGVVTAILHIWKRNSLLSICIGTALYMVLIKINPAL